VLAERRLVVHPKALAHAIVGGARARQAPLEAVLEGAPSSPPRQAAALRVGANATTSGSKSARSACVPAPQETQSTQCPRSWSGPRCGAPPSLLQSSAGTKTEIAAEAPNVTLTAFGEGAKARVFRTRAQIIAARATACVSLPFSPGILIIVPASHVAKYFYAYTSAAFTGCSARTYDAQRVPILTRIIATPRPFQNDKVRSF
jgi:hypothetical protein